ncbi:hypothetical protein MBRA1_000304 [Malassezia brasiliensis]|uniref:Uncharacterized protein n=1 Tax=Malassezia brasiliensis TaxID=1821822 RepID=A0AAF0DQR0_9BASI|nr:hypothetical protein MBRA1_000304 [Malassezia brasiliensis]
MVNAKQLETTRTPAAPVYPLGAAPLHGLPRSKHLVVVLGVGPGLGLAIARVFAAQGYATAILSRTKSRLDKYATELDALARTRIRERGEFLQLNDRQLKDSIDASVFAFFTFAQLALGKMVEHNQGGTLLVTGATSSIRGREGFVPFAAAKGALRNMCQSLAREFGQKNIHVAHIVVDGLIESKTALAFFQLPTDERFMDGNVGGPCILTRQALVPDQMAKTWLFLAQQHPSTWTSELDLRPAKEKF